MLFCCIKKTATSIPQSHEHFQKNDSIRIRSWSIPAEMNPNNLKDAGFSFTSFNSFSSRKISDKDNLNYSRVKTLISTKKRKYAALSVLVKKQITRMNFTSLEQNNYHDADDVSEQILQKVIPFVETLLQKRHDKSEAKEEYEVFNLNSAPRMSLRFYLSRLMSGLNNWYYKEEDSTEIGIRCLFLSLIYIDNLPEQVPQFRVTKLNIYKLFAIFMLVAAKFTEDEVIGNSYWALISGYTAEEVTELEAAMCFELNFTFDADPASIRNLFRFFDEKQVNFGRDSFDDYLPRDSYLSI